MLAMTTGISFKADIAGAPLHLPAFRSGSGLLSADTKHSAENEIRSGIDQMGRSPEDPGQIQEAVMKPLRVLIVEDDLTIGPLLAETLEQLGHVVCALEVDAVAAVSAARRCDPDLMIVDIGLGEASGIAAVEQILEEGFVPHVFVTGDGLRSLPLGPEAVVIQKPYRSADLIAAIAKAMKGSVKRRESGLA
jgi:CheY-like chemotaxis protein